MVLSLRSVVASRSWTMVLEVCSWFLSKMMDVASLAASDGTTAGTVQDDLHWRHAASVVVSMRLGCPGEVSWSLTVMAATMAGHHLADPVKVGRFDGHRRDSG